jgi:carbonic anhydrase
LSITPHQVVPHMDSLRVTINPNYNTRLKPIKTAEEIPAPWQGTPIGKLIQAHNFDVPIAATGKPELLVATCIEFRFQPRVPSFYAYIIRRASGRVIGAEFTVAYALAKGVKHMALIGHNDCGMTKVAPNAEVMIDALVAQEWPREEAEAYVKAQGPRHAITDEVDALRDEYMRLRRLFRHIEIAPLFAALGNDKLYVPNWYYELADQSNADLGPVQKEDVQSLP